MVGSWIDETEYPQAPSMDKAELEAFFEQALFARLGTINEDGSVHIAPVYFKYEDNQILMATQEPSRKIKNIKRDNRVTVLIDTTDVPFKGALIYGTAELEYENISNDFNKTMNDVYDFLGASRVELEEPKLKKIAYLKPNEELANYDKLKAHFQNTEFEKYFIY